MAQLCPKAVTVIAYFFWRCCTVNTSHYAIICTVTGWTQCIVTWEFTIQ